MQKPKPSEILLNSLREHLSEDLNSYFGQSDRIRSPVGRHATRKKFATYLITVATSQIPTVDPRIKCKLEEILIYIMYLFSYSGAQLKRMINEASVQKDPSKLISQVVNISPPTKNLNLDFASCHLRLYSNCLMYQVTIINAKQLSRIVFDSQLDVSLENLFYMPVYPLLERHRLYSNLTRVEDQSLRRSALLMLLTKLDDLNPGKTDRLKANNILLLTITKNEYFIAQHGPNQTEENKKECKGISEQLDINCRGFIMDLELMIIEKLVRKHLVRRLEDWIARGFTDSQTHHGEQMSEKTATLLTLRLTKMIIRYYKQRPSRISDYVINLKQKVQSTLRDLITSQFKARLQKLIGAGSTFSVPKNKTPRDDLQPDDSWRKILCDIQMIENDLRLYWSSKGIDGLMGCVDIPDGFSSSTSSAIGQQSNLSKLIEMKLRIYLGN